MLLSDMGITSGTGNIGNVPLVLIAALCRDQNNPFGDSEKCSTDGTAYISFGQWVSLDLLLISSIFVQNFLFQLS